MSYLSHFQLRYEPFGNAPDRRFYWPSGTHEMALSRLRFAVTEARGLALCTGPVGHGKTTLARRLYDELPAGEFVKGLLVVIHSDVTGDWLLRKIAELLGARNAGLGKLEVLGAITARLRSIYESGRGAVILVDEAQMLARRELMEEFRGLLNVEVQGGKLINFVFFGLPETEAILALDPPLENRVALRVHLRPFDLEGTRRYVAHRLKVAGGDTALFPAEVLERIQFASRGAPRLINTLCDNLLLECYLANSADLSVERVDKIAQDMGLKGNGRSTLITDILGRNTPGEIEEGLGWDVNADGDLDDLLGFLDDA